MSSNNKTAARVSYAIPEPSGEITAQPHRGKVTLKMKSNAVAEDENGREITLGPRAERLTLQSPIVPELAPVVTDQPALETANALEHVRPRKPRAVLGNVSRLRSNSGDCNAAIPLLILLTESLHITLAVWIEEFLAALLPRRFEFGCCDVPVRPAFLGNGT
jgi:hypothetical protein